MWEKIKIKSKKKKSPCDLLKEAGYTIKITKQEMRTQIEN